MADDNPGSVDTGSTSMNSEGRKKLHGWLNKRMKICMTDGRTLIGTFLCTDKDRNVILGSCEEYVNPPDSEEKEDPRVLGLAMVPGPHIMSINVDLYTPSQAVV